VPLGSVTYPGVAGHHAWEFHHVFYQFSPRAGFVYTANVTSVVRGGIGLFFKDAFNALNHIQFSAAKLLYVTSDGLFGTCQPGTAGAGLNINHYIQIGGRITW